MNRNYSSQNDYYLSRDQNDANKTSNKTTYQQNVTGFQSPTNLPNTHTLQNNNYVENRTNFQEPRTLSNSTILKNPTNFQNPSSIRHPSSFKTTTNYSNATNFPNAFNASITLNEPFTSPYTINRPTIPPSLRVNNPELTSTNFLSNHSSGSHRDKAANDPSKHEIAQCEPVLGGNIGNKIWKEKTSQNFRNGLPQRLKEDTDDEEEEQEEEEEDLPFLEELGIHPQNVWEKTKSVLLFRTIDQDILQDADMCGPVFIAACLGCCSLLAGKINFEYIYGLNVTGSIGVFLLLNLMSQKQGISLYSTISVLGYGLFPVVILSCIALFFPLRCLMGGILSVLCVIWCTATASRFFETALEMTHQRFLVAYPISLLYGSFVLLTVF